MPLFNADGTPFVDTPRYTPKDPRWELTLCGGCRRWPHRCVSHEAVDHGAMAGIYRCACLTCRVKGAS